MVEEKDVDSTLHKFFQEEKENMDQGFSSLSLKVEHLFLLDAVEWQPRVKLLFFFFLLF